MQKNNSLIWAIILSALNVVISYISTGYVAIALEVLLSLYVLYLINVSGDVFCDSYEEYMRRYNE